MTEKKVRKIEATAPLRAAQAFTPVKKRRVAAYARVSTDKDEQQNSYEAQVDYYTTHIQSNPEWMFAGVYSDAGITGTSMKKRDGFNQMVTDALAGKIDLILTKSVSRFARNTVDSLTTVRKLKEKGVEVYFEKENIYTLDSKGELLITIMSSLAQEEARNISDNTAWGQRKRFADGKMSLGYSHFLGYKKGAADGEMEIVEEEAVIVRRIYAEFLAGKSTYDIAARLTKDGIPTPAKKTVWHASTVDSILHNEKYKGDAILQKRFTVDFLSKKTKKNEGEYPQYYIENNHPAIIRPEVFEMVQEEFRRRQAAGGHAQCKTPFSGRIVCADCGGFYGRKVWHAGSKYAKVHWHCNNKFQKRRYCSTPTLKEKSIEECFVAAFNGLLARKAEIAEDYALCLDAITDTSAYQARLDAINRECGELSTLINALCAAKRVQVGAFLTELEKRKTPLTKFDPLVWQATLNHMRVNPDCTVTFVFRDGTEVSQTIENGVRQYKKRGGTEGITDGK